NTDTVNQPIIPTRRSAATIGTAPGNSTINCSATPTFTPPTASDACSGATVNLLTNTTTGNSCTRIYTQTWDATDACGNHSATVTQTITTTRTHPPPIETASANSTINCTATPSFTP